jgi:fructan beta-fructosidase
MKRIFIACLLNLVCLEGFAASAGGVAVNFTDVNNRYLLLPMEDRGVEYRVDILVDSVFDNFFTMRPAVSRTDYWVPFDVSKYKGRNVSLNVLGYLPANAIFLKEARLSDTFIFDYNEQFRPEYHFSPLYGWTNDPNGMVYYDGEYHLFYQWNPYGTKWQNMTWGHAVSTDLFHWKYLPASACIFPDSLGAVFSGSAVVDKFGMAGEKTLLAFYTQSERGGQWNSLAYSNNKGRTWTKYSGNPVLKHKSSPDFRDPKVFWYDGATDAAEMTSVDGAAGKWIMALAVKDHVEIYSSKNARDWTFESEFGRGEGNHFDVWECPDLFELPTAGNTNKKKWVLLVNNSLSKEHGSGTQYFIGSFDGHTFKNDNAPNIELWLDYGKDHYATVTWADAPQGRHIGIAWMNNWQYANDVPGRNFRSVMSVPREFSLVEHPDANGQWLLAAHPVKEFDALRGTGKDIKIGEDGNLKLNMENGMYELEVEAGINTVTRQKHGDIIELIFSNDNGGQVVLTVDFYKKQIQFDRTKSGITDFSPHFPSFTIAPLYHSSKFRILIDKCSVEIFSADGLSNMTNIVFPHEPYNKLSVKGKCKIKIYPLAKTMAYE